MLVHCSLANTRLRLNLIWDRVWWGAVHFLVFEAGSMNVNRMLVFATGQTYSQSYQRYIMTYSEPVGSSMNTSFSWRKNHLGQVFVLLSKWTCLPIYLAHCFKWLLHLCGRHSGCKQSRSTVVIVLSPPSHSMIGSLSQVKIMSWWPC